MLDRAKCRGTPRRHANEPPGLRLVSRRRGAAGRLHRGGQRDPGSRRQRRRRRRRCAGRRCAGDRRREAAIDISIPTPDAACTPVSCTPPAASIAVMIGDGCHAAKDCPACTGAGQTCTDHICVEGPTASAARCTAAGGARYCGRIGTGCGDAIDCGTCSGRPDVQFRRRLRPRELHARRAATSPAAAAENTAAGSATAAARRSTAPAARR